MVRTTGCQRFADRTDDSLVNTKEELITLGDYQGMRQGELGEYQVVGDGEV